MYFKWMMNTDIWRQIISYVEDGQSLVNLAATHEYFNHIIDVNFKALCINHNIYRLPNETWASAFTSNGSRHLEPYKHINPCTSFATAGYMFAYFEPNSSLIIVGSMDFNDDLRDIIPVDNPITHLSFLNNGNLLSYCIATDSILALHIYIMKLKELVCVKSFPISNDILIDNGSVYDNKAKIIFDGCNQQTYHLYSNTACAMKCEYDEDTNHYFVFREKHGIRVVNTIRGEMMLIKNFLCDLPTYKFDKNHFIILAKSSTLICKNQNVIEIHDIKNKLILKSHHCKETPSVTYEWNKLKEWIFCPHFLIVNDELITDCETGHLLRYDHQKSEWIEEDWKRSQVKNKHFYSKMFGPPVMEEYILSLRKEAFEFKQFKLHQTVGCSKVYPSSHTFCGTQSSYLSNGTPSMEKGVHQLFIA